MIDIIKIIIAFLIGIVPLSYGIYLYIKVNKIIKTSTEEQMVEDDKKIGWMKRSSLMFFLVGAIMLYEGYKLLF